jgi:hypothetical protein
MGLDELVGGLDLRYAPLHAEDRAAPCDAGRSQPLQPLLRDLGAQQLLRDLGAQQLHALQLGDLAQMRIGAPRPQPFARLMHRLLRRDDGIGVESAAAVKQLTPRANRDPLGTRFQSGTGHRERSALASTRPATFPARVVQSHSTRSL